jgi:hypothetical protein
MAFGQEGCRVPVVEDEASVSILIEDMLGDRVSALRRP